MRIKFWTPEKKEYVVNSGNIPIVGQRIALRGQYYVVDEVCYHLAEMPVKDTLHPHWIVCNPSAEIFLRAVGDVLSVHSQALEMHAAVRRVVEYKEPHSIQEIIEILKPFVKE